MLRQRRAYSDKAARGAAAGQHMGAQDKPGHRGGSRTRGLAVGAVALALAVVGFLVVGHFTDRSAPVYQDAAEHFKYGSIGTEPDGGLPYWMWKALPVVFQDKLGPRGFETFGMLYETAGGK